MFVRHHAGGGKVFLGEVVVVGLVGQLDTPVTSRDETPFSFRRSAGG